MTASQFEAACWHHSPSLSDLPGRTTWPFFQVLAKDCSQTAMTGQILEIGQILCRLSVCGDESNIDTSLPAKGLA